MKEQTAVRRAVSTAYYALFHLIVEEATAARYETPSDAASMNAYGRKLDHAPTYKIAETIMDGGQAKAHLVDILSSDVSERVAYIIDTLMSLQDCRIASDYDRIYRLKLRDAMTLVRSADKAVRFWHEAKAAKDPTLKMFVACIVAESDEAETRKRPNRRQRRRT
ncbi:MAG: hypothetical protein Q8S73_33115 [Deltaproteobacteria bacterium]|nr:hypothetical protein [Myxococcales bacterium]MDP3218987.1 hypothetical protein [Deltaproteobacteria bacterium]